MRSQTYAKSLPMPMVIGALKRLDLIRNHPEYQENLWKIVRALQNGFREARLRHRRYARHPSPPST